MECDTTGLTFDISSTAGFYSQMAGVLAAFAFGAITFALPRMNRRATPTDPSGNRDALSDPHFLLVLVAAFISLIIATFEYAVLAGERGCALIEGRAASEELLGGVAFAFAVLLLMYAIVQLVTHSDVVGIGYHTRLIVTILVPSLIVLFLATAAEDVAAAPLQLRRADMSYAPLPSTFYRQISAIALPLPLLMFILCVIMWFTGSRCRRECRSSRRPRRTLFSFALFPYIPLVLAVIAVVRSTTLAGTDPSAHVVHWETWMWLLGCSVILLLQAALLSFERGADAIGDSANSRPHA